MVQHTSSTVGCLFAACRLQPHHPVAAVDKTISTWHDAGSGAHGTYAMAATSVSISGEWLLQHMASTWRVLWIGTTSVKGLWQVPWEAYIWRRFGHVVFRVSMPEGVKTPSARGRQRQRGCQCQSGCQCLLNKGCPATLLSRPSQHGPCCALPCPFAVVKRHGVCWSTRQDICTCLDQLQWGWGLHSRRRLGCVVLYMCEA